MFFSGQVASSNTVGYQKLALVEGFNWIAPQFLAVGENPINIQSIQLSFADGCEAQGGDNIQILDADGVTIHSYAWMPGDWIGASSDGWADESGVGLADVTLDPGQSFLLSVEQAGTSILVAGEVASTDYVTTGVAGFNWVGNTTPSTINIQEILLDFGTGEAQGGDNIQILDADGVTIHSYAWMPGDWIGASSDGWADESGVGLADVTLDAGQGILLAIETDGTTITVPSAL